MKILIFWRNYPTLTYRVIKILTILIAFIALPSLAQEIQDKLPAGFVSLSTSSFSSTALFVDKSKKKIYLIKDIGGKPQVTATYDADLGKKPGDKHSTGDRRTPEGIYFFDRMIDGSQLDNQKYGALAFVTDYPNFFDKLNNKSGYGIWLHAIADTVSLERGSQGCVVVRNETIKKLQTEISLKHTPILIFNKINWVSYDQVTSEKEKIQKVINQWKTSWQTKNIDQYISFYDPKFRFGKMNLEKFKIFKTDLAQKYNNISVKLSEPQIFEHGGNAIVKFYQDYSSNEHSDFGEKTLYVEKTNNGEYKIIGEFWEETPDLTKKTAAIY